MRQLEASFATLRSEVENRMSAAQAAPQIAAQQQPSQGQRLQTAGEQSLVPEAAAALRVDEGDPEQVYLAGFKLWEQKRFGDAQQALEAMAKRYPSHPKASWARNLAGRALLDDGKPAAAAKVLFANYETDPKGERAPDSLFYLGQALTQLKKTAEACQVYGELQDVFGASLRDQIKKDLPRARKAAGCS
jgi:TolA-binding protein